MLKAPSAIICVSGLMPLYEARPRFIDMRPPGLDDGGVIATTRHQRRGQQAKHGTL